MSFEVFLQCFGETERTGISRAAVRSLFPVSEEESEPDRWRARYDDLNYCDVSVSPIPSNQEFLSALCIWRPCGDPKLWEALLRLLRMGSAFMYWAGSPPVVADDAVCVTLPEEIAESLGQPRVVTSVEDVRRLLRET